MIKLPISMACCPIVLLLSTISPCSIRFSFKDLRLGRTLDHRRFCTKLIQTSVVRHSRSLTASADGQLDPATASRPSDNEKEELAAKLAAAEAEAEELRNELATRRISSDIDLSKLKPVTPEKRIDGTGYRETLLSGPVSSEERPNKWGLSEAELFRSKGAPTEGGSQGVSAVQDDANEVVMRRLVIGVGMAVLSVCLSFFKLPAGFVKPAKPLFFYLVPILRFRDQLKSIEASSSDANTVRQKLLKATSSIEVSKDTFLSATGWLEGKKAEQASSLTYAIFDYLNQADYRKYFENIGPPSSSQELSFLEFSLQAIQAARKLVDEFLSLMPKEAMEAAQSNLTSNVYFESAEGFT